jgi:acyl-CoA synthetase (AMP-forming)/AMP-acid ligase II
MKKLEVPSQVGNQFRAAGFWTDERLLDRVRDLVRATPGETAVVDETGRMTYGELWAQAANLAHWLAARGVAAGDAVSAQLPNWREMAVIHLATEMLGAVINPLLPLYREHELSHIMRTCEAKVFFAPEEHRSFDGFIPMARGLVEQVPSLTHVVSVRSTGRLVDNAVVFAWENAVAGNNAAPEPPPFAGDDPVLVTFSSGTESLPKGCVHSHNTTLYALREGAIRFGLEPNDVVFMPSPIGHTTGFQWGIRMAWYLGTRLVLQDRWDANVAAGLITAENCTYSLAATPFIGDLLDAVEFADEAAGIDMSSLRMFVCGGAPIPRALIARSRVVLGAELLACYGTSESYILSQVGLRDDDDTKQTDGTPLPGVEIRVVDDDGEEVPSGTPGECVTRGPHVMLGYLNPPADRPDYVPGDWFAIGDLVERDDLGRLRVVGRKKEIIIRGGLNISPREVEEALMRHEGVRKVAVVGYPDDRLGERACAVVVTSRPALQLGDLTTFLVHEGLATYKLPERILLVDELPMTASGKVQKFKLAQLITDGETP